MEKQYSGHLYFLLKPRPNSLLSELFIYKIVAKILDQTNFSDEVTSVSMF